MTALPLIAVMIGSLAAALFFRWLKLPLWPMTGGLIGAASVNLGLDLAVEVPEAATLIAQLLIGTAIGSTIGPDVFRQFLHIFAPGILAVTALLIAGLLFGWAFSALGLMELEEAMFSLMPGGVGELVTAAVALGMDGAVVIGAHVVRLFTVIWSLPLVFWAADKIHQRWITPPDGEDS